MDAGSSRSQDKNKRFEDQGFVRLNRQDKSEPDFTNPYIDHFEQ